MKDPIDVLRDLVEQLDGIGIPDWNGAEGLCLQEARDLLEKNPKKALPEKGKSHDENRV